MTGTTSGDRAAAMNLKHLEVFRAVMTTGSTIAAGSALQMSQSAISRQLSALEAELGFALFHRDRGRLVPTAEAHALIPEVGQTIERLALMRRKAEDLRAGTGTSLFVKVAFPHSMTTTVLPGIVTGVAEGPETADAAFTLFPSPATDQVRIDGVPSGSTCTIADAQSRTVRVFMLQDSTERIDVSTFIPGLYLMTLRDARGVLIGIRRFVRG